MVENQRLSPVAQLAVATFGVLSLVGACLIASYGGFTTDTGGRGNEYTFVSGPEAIAMALIQLAGAWTAFSAVLAQYFSKRKAYLVSIILVSAVPLAILTMR